MSAHTKIRRAYAVGCFFVLATALLFAGLGYAWATRPIATAAQVEEATRRVEQARNALPTSCPRPVLRGVALPGDGAEELGQLAGASSPWLPCLSFVGAHRWSPSSGPTLPISVLLAHEREALALCAGIDTEVQALLQRGSGCTSQPLFSNASPDMRGLADVLILLARARAHEGQVQEGAELLLDVVRLGQDFTRGPASLVPSDAGLQVQGGALRELEVLLATDLPWTSAMLEELERQARVLIDTMPDPLAWFEYDALWVRQLALDQLRGQAAEVLSEGALVDIAAAEYGDTHWPECTSLETCAPRYREAIAQIPRGPEAHRFHWIPGIERAARIRAAHEARLRQREAALTVASVNEALLRTLPALFLHRRMSLAGTCPSARSFQAEARAAGLGERFEVTQVRMSPHPLELHGTGTDTDLRAYCPALGEENAGGLP